MLWHTEFEISCIRKLTFYLRVFDQDFILKDPERGDYFKCMIPFCLNFTGERKCNIGVTIFFIYCEKMLITQVKFLDFTAKK